MTDRAIPLSDDEALVLFEWLARAHETGSFAFTDTAERLVVSRLHARLERELSEPAQADYRELHRAACARVRARFGQTWPSE